MGQEFVVPSFNTNRYYNRNTDSVAVLPSGTAGSVLFLGSGAMAVDSTNFFWDDTNNRLGIGTNSPSYPLHIVGGDAADATAPAFFVNRTAVASDDEAIARFGVSGLTDYLQIENTSTSAVHLPGLRGFNSTTNIALTLIAEGTTDTGSNAVMKFLARIGASTAVATRPMFTWNNGSSTEVMALDATGKLTFGAAGAYAVPSGAKGALHYNTSTGIMTLAAYSSSGNTQFALNTAVGAGTNATRMAINSAGAMTLTPATTLGVTTNGGSTFTETASNTEVATFSRNSTSNSIYGIKIANTGTSGYGSAINWELTATGASPTTYTAARIDVQNTAAAGGGYMAFTTAGVSSTTLAEVARVYNDTFLIGKTSGVIGTNGILQVRAPSAASTGEVIATFDVSDDTSGYIQFSNGTSSDSAFIPVITGVNSGTLQALFLTGQATTDTGTSPVTVMHARVGSGTIVATRPAFQFRNHTTTVGGFTGSTNNNRLIIGGNTLTAYSANSRNIEVNQSANSSGFVANAWSTNDSQAGVLEFNKATSATVGTMTGAVASGESLGYITFSGTDGTSFIQGAAIKAEVDGTTGTNDMPGRLIFSTTADGAAAVTERMRIDTVGRVLLGSATANGSPSSATALLQVQQPAATQETIAWFAVDDSTGSMVIMNGSSTATAFTGQLRGLGTTTVTALALQGRGTTDTGTNPITAFNSNIGGNTDVATRPAWQWQNNATNVMEISGTTAGSHLKTYYGRVQALRNVASTTITVAVTDDVVVSTTGGGAVAASLPASPETGRRYTIKDGVGDAGTNNITITPAAGNIDGAGTKVINSNYGSWTGIYNGTQWLTV